MDDVYERKLKKILAIAKCPKCNTVYPDREARSYICPNCGYEEPTNFGIVRTYLEKNGNASALEISRETGVPISEINSFLRNGRLEIPESSEVFINCKKCGVEIRYGQYCPSCAQNLARELKGAFDTSTVGPIPKNMSGKMHVLKNLRNS